MNEVHDFCVFHKVVIAVKVISMKVAFLIMASQFWRQNRLVDHFRRLLNVFISILESLLKVI